MQKIFDPTPAKIKDCASALFRGEVVAFPTETVYGLGASIAQEKGVLKIFETKKRPTFDPLIVHVALKKASFRELSDWDLIDHQAMSDTEVIVADQLIKAFWPGPLTIILPKLESVSDLITSGLPTVGIRMPNHPVALQLIQSLGEAICAPSANLFGRVSPTQASHVIEELGEKIYGILDGGTCSVGVESTVVKISPQGIIHILRPGGVSPERLAIASPQSKIETTYEHTAAIAHPKLGLLSPGSTKSHYQPRTKVVALQQFLSQQNSLSNPSKPHKIAFLFCEKKDSEYLSQIQNIAGAEVVFEYLSKTGNADEAAQNLFSTLRSLDQKNLDRIVAEIPTHEDGLWWAIRDRLTRAIGTPST